MNHIPFTYYPPLFPMCISLFWSVIGMAAVSDPDEPPYTGPPPPPVLKGVEMFVSFRFAETLQHLVDTGLAGEGYRSWLRPPSFRRIHLN